MLFNIGLLQRMDKFDRHLENKKNTQKYQETYYSDVPELHCAVVVWSVGTGSINSKGRKGIVW